MKQALLLIMNTANITACKNKCNKYYCLKEQMLILLLVRTNEASITAYKNEANITACKNRS